MFTSSASSFSCAAWFTRCISQRPSINEFTSYCGNLVSVWLMLEPHLLQLVLKLQLYESGHAEYLSTASHNLKEQQISICLEKLLYICHQFHNICSTYSTYIYIYLYKTSTYNIHDYATRDEMSGIQPEWLQTTKQTTRYVERLVAEVTTGFDSGV